MYSDRMCFAWKFKRDKMYPLKSTVVGESNVLYLWLRAPFGTHRQDEQLRHDLVGSWAFMAPEVLQRAHHPQACDL